MDSKIVEEILKMPQAYLVMRQINDALDEERALRQRFYESITEQEKVEFINGEVIFHSPVRIEHNHVNGMLYQLLSIYVRRHQLGFVGMEKIMISLTRNDYEPDICFFGREKSDQFKKQQTLFPAPDLIVEVLSKGTEDRDRGIKFEDYEAHDIREYWLINPIDEWIEQYHLVNGHYKLHLKTGMGEIESLVLPGFQIPIAAMFDEEINLREINRILMGGIQ